MTNGGNQSFRRQLDQVALAPAASSAESALSLPEARIGVPAVRIGPERTDQRQPVDVRHHEILKDDGRAS
jgi:hypothetical protein